MNKFAEATFSTRSAVVLELPLEKHTRILRPESTIVKIGNFTTDLGACCYANRSCAPRKKGKPREVALDSLLPQRPRQIRQLIKALSRLMTEGGLRLQTVKVNAVTFKCFIDWADDNGMHDCLSGDDESRRAYTAWVELARELYNRQKVTKSAYNTRLRITGDLLSMITGLERASLYAPFMRTTEIAANTTEPLAPQKFAHVIALSQALFDGLCDLVLEQRPFPYKLKVPISLGWTDSYLWLFPAAAWIRPPHERGHAREKHKLPSWAYDFDNGCLANPSEIAKWYKGASPSIQLKRAKTVRNKAQRLIDLANRDLRHRMRIMLGMIAQRAFQFLFVSNTSCNFAVARDIETSGEIDASTSNQQFRSVKFRANSKSISIVVPMSFMPSVRRFMELRRYLLNDESYPFLFFTLGTHNANPPEQMQYSTLEVFHRYVLSKIDPTLPKMGVRILRASVADWYQRHHDASITAKILQNSERTTQKHYDAGSQIDHREELSCFLKAVSESAKRQRIVSSEAADTSPLLEEGGRCNSFGSPEAMADNVPVTPNCRNGQGCLFCANRVLVACEEDVRKIASAAFVMEQLILGPKHEAELRPLIAKCDQDLEKIASFRNCRSMVEHVRQDVFENGNLTHFFADKYQLFLEVGVVV